MWKPALVEIEDALVPAFVVESSMTGASQSSCRRYLHHSPGPCTSSTGSACISSTSHSLRLSGRVSMGIEVKGPGGGDEQGEPVAKRCRLMRIVASGFREAR